MTKNTSKKFDSPHNQGEGDREAAERYEESTKRFIRSGQVKEATEKARAQNPKEAGEAEEKGKARAKAEDPAVRPGSKSKI